MMQPSISADRPPFVQFETIAVKNNARSLEEGRLVYEDRDMANVVSAGSKDVHVVLALEWLARKKSDALNGRYPMEWYQRHQAQYDEWKKGNELPEEGTPIKMWPPVTPAEAAMLIGANVRTVEDLAALPESGLTLLGIGSRSLRDKARAWLESQTANGAGKMAEELSALKVENAALADALDRMQAQIKELETDRKRGPGRPRKDEAEAA